MNTEQVINYIKERLYTNHNGVRPSLRIQALSRYKENFVYADGEQPFDTNYNARIAFEEGLEYAYEDILDKLKKSVEHPSTETMLKLFWFFDKHGLIKEDLCFDPQHFIDTVAKEHIDEFDMEKYCKTGE